GMASRVAGQMSDYFPYMITGLTDGSIYAIAALGLVLTYKTSGIFNFAHGAVAAAAAYIFFELWQKHGWPWPIAGFVVIFVLPPPSACSSSSGSADSGSRCVAWSITANSWI